MTVGSEAFGVGARVRHAIFGCGEVRGGGAERQCTVRFDDGREVSIWQPGAHLELLAMSSQPNGSGHPDEGASDGHTLPFATRWLPLDILKHDPERAQRPFSPQRAKQMARHLSTERAGAICVNHCTDDDCYYIMDGKHRAAAFALAFETHIYCHVWRVSKQEEARLFRELNSDRVPVRPLFLFNARVTEGDPEAVAIAAIIRECGYHISGDKTQNKGAITCIGQLERLYRSRVPCAWRRPTQPTPERLRACLGLLFQTWGHRPGAVGEVVVGAVDLLLQTYGEDVDRAHFASRLCELDPQLLARRAREQRKELDMRPEECLASTLRQKYNAGRHSARRLPPRPWAH